MSKFGLVGFRVWVFRVWELGQSSSSNPEPERLQPYNLNLKTLMEATADKINTDIHTCCLFNLIGIYRIYALVLSN